MVDSVVVVASFGVGAKTLSLRTITSDTNKLLFLFLLLYVCMHKRLVGNPFLLILQ